MIRPDDALPVDRDIPPRPAPRAVAAGPYVAAAAIGAAYAIPLWAAPFPIMQDLAANTETACQLLHIWRGDPKFASLLMVHEQPWANSAPSLVLAALLSVIPTLAATKLLLTVVTIAWPLSLAVCFARFGRSPWLAVLCAPLTYDLAWSFGFVHFLCAKPLVPLCLVAAHRAVTGTRLIRDGVVLFVAVTALWWMHTLPWLLAMAGVAVVAVVCARRASHALRAAPALLSIVVALPFIFASRGVNSQHVTKLRDPLAALSSFWADLGDLRAGALDGVAHVTALALVVAGAALCVRVARGELTSWPRERIALLAVALGFFAAWLVGPPVLPQASVISPRLLSLGVAMLVGVLAVIPPVRGAHVALATAMALAALVHIGGTTLAYRAFSRDEMGDFTALLARHVERGSRIATHYTSPFSPYGRHNAMWHWGKLACLTSGAATDDTFAYRQTAFVEIKAKQLIAPPHRLERNKLRPYDYLLVRGGVGATRAIDDMLVPLGATGSWRLYRLRWELDL